LKIGGQQKLIVVIFENTRDYDTTQGPIINSYSGIVPSK